MDEQLRHKVCRLIAGIVVSDDDLDTAEDAFIDRMLTRFGIPLSQRESIFPIVDRSEAAAEMQLLAPDVQQEALTLLIEAAAADGQIAAEERAYLHTVAEAIGLTTDEIDHRIATRMGA